MVNPKDLVDEKQLIGLMDSSFKAIPKAEHLVPDMPGIYVIRVKSPSSILDVFQKELKTRNHNLLYIGIASQSLKKRFLGQELQAKGHGTFFRSIGAVLGYKPPKGSLVGKSNQRNYKFSKSDEAKIIKWLDENLLINWLPFEGDSSEAEAWLIKKYKPILNIAKNPFKMQEMQALRAWCVKVATDV